MRLRRMRRPKTTMGKRERIPPLTTVPLGVELRHRVMQSYFELKIRK